MNGEPPIIYVRHSYRKKENQLGIYDELLDKLEAARALIPYWLEKTKDVRRDSGPEHAWANGLEEAAADLQKVLDKGSRV